MSQDTYDTSVAPMRCPACGAVLEAYRTTRFTTAGGRWRMSPTQAWTAKCANGHEGTKETLPAAVTEISRLHGG